MFEEAHSTLFFQYELYFIYYSELSYLELSNLCCINVTRYYIKFIFSFISMNYQSATTETRKVQIQSDLIELSSKEDYGWYS